MGELRVDHVIYAVEELDTAAQRFRDEFGLASVVGGRHPGWGTANRIVPLGHDYVELVSVADREQAAASEFGRSVMDVVASGRRLIGWAVATDDLQGIASRLDLEVMHGSRITPDGSALRWQLAGVARALSPPGRCRSLSSGTLHRSNTLGQLWRNTTFDRAGPRGSRSPPR